MIKVYPYEELGHHDFEWLDARYHFSFANYHNPDRMGFGVLRVINDDIVKSGKGFDTHGHKDMEIITFVRKGAITHRDSMENEGKTAAGDVQVMSAGKGVLHSEYNLEDEDTNLYQIWIYPRENAVKPSWDAREFPRDPVNDHLPLLVSGRDKHKNSGALYIHQNASIYGGRLTAGHELTHGIDDQAYILVSSGSVAIDGIAIKKGDGAEVTQQDTITIKAQKDAEIIVIDVPPLS